MRGHVDNADLISLVGLVMTAVFESGVNPMRYGWPGVISESTTRRAATSTI
jgi:hypothetical protein